MTLLEFGGSSEATRSVEHQDTGMQGSTAVRTADAAGVLCVRLAVPDDIDHVKHIADVNRHELGFVVRASLEDACRRASLFVALLSHPDSLSRQLLIGFVQAHFRRDRQVTLHTIAVDQPYRFRGVGHALISALLDAACERQMQVVLLRCPIDLAANAFYETLGFQCSTIEPGKRRQLAVWTYVLKRSQNE